LTNPIRCDTIAALYILYNFNHRLQH